MVTRNYPHPSGCPSHNNKGDVISGLKLGNSEAKVCHACTKEIDGKVTTNGGRVLCATALGNTVPKAQN